MAQMDNIENVWQLSIPVVKKGNQDAKTLFTGGKYVDKDIEIVASVTEAKMGVDADSNGELSNTASLSAADGILVAKDASNASAIAITATSVASVEDVIVKTVQAGFTDTTDKVTVEGSSNTETEVKYIKAGKLEGSGDATITSEKVKITKGTGDFQIVAVAAGGSEVTESGWLEAGTAAESSASTPYSIQKMTFGNSATADSYTDISESAPVLISGDYLYINEGYLQDSKISLAKLVPDGAVITNVIEGKNPLLYKTEAMYDSDGKLIGGSMQDATLSDITAEDAAVLIPSVTVTAKENAFEVTGEGTIQGTTSVSIVNPGYATTDLQKTGTISGTGVVKAEIAVIGTDVNVSGDGAVTPVITADTASTAKVADAATTTQPTDGFYVAVSTAKIEKTATVTPIVTSAGYGTADKSNATPESVVAGANASGMYYVPVQSGSWSVADNNSDVVAPVTTVTTAVNTGDVTPVTYAAKTEGKQYVTITAGASTTDGSVQTSATITVNEGYVAASSKTEMIKETVSVEDASANAVHIEVYDGSWA